MKEHIVLRVPIERKRVKVHLTRSRLDEPYHVRWSFKKPYHRSTKEHNLAAAKKVAVEYVEREASKAAGVHPALSILIKLYLEERKLSALTKRESGIRLNCFLEFAHDIKFTILSREDATDLIRAYIASRDVAPQSMKNDRSVLSRFCSWLIRRDRVHWAMNPASPKKVEIPRVVRRKKAGLSDDDVDAFLDVAPVSVKIAAALLLSGVRARSILERLEWEDINFELSTVKTIEKEDDERELALGDWAMSVLKAYRGKGRLFKFTAKRFWEIFQETSAKAGVKITPQALRRKFTNVMQANGVNPYDESALAGHSLAVADKHYREGHAATLHKVANLIKFGQKSGQNGTEQWTDEDVLTVDVS